MPTAAENQGLIVDYASGHSYSAARLRYLLALWISHRHRPYKIVTDPELVEIFKMLYSKVDIVSPSTISRDIQDMHAIAKRNVAKSLQSTRGRLHFGINGWSSPNVISFLGVTVTRCVKGVMEEFVLDFIR